MAREMGGGNDGADGHMDGVENMLHFVHFRANRISHVREMNCKTTRPRVRSLSGDF